MALAYKVIDTKRTKEKTQVAPLVPLSLVLDQCFIWKNTCLGLSRNTCKYILGQVHFIGNIDGENRHWLGTARWGAGGLGRSCGLDIGFESVGMGSTTHTHTCTYMHTHADSPQVSK